MKDLVIDKLQNEAISMFNNESDKSKQAFAYGWSMAINWFIDHGYVKEELQ